MSSTTSKTTDHQPAAKTMSLTANQATDAAPTQCEHKASRLRGGGAGKDCLIGLLGAFVCCECCEGCIDCIGDILCCPCEMCC